MLYPLKRHLMSIRAAQFRHCLVVNYAFPRGLLEPLLPPGLVLDTHGEWGFVAVALVQTEGLRPAWLPALFGMDFFLAGYRILTRFQTASGRSLRGLLILRSDTDRWLMTVVGNLLTHYGYRRARVRWEETGQKVAVAVRTPGAAADLDLVADLASKPAPLPPGSPFADAKESRRFAGPLPFTFDYERETGSMLVVQGVRQAWDPQPVSVEVRQCTFFRQPPFREVEPVLANAFHLTGVPYLWRRGVRHRLALQADAPPAKATS
jgi:hypothetical protein